MISYDKKRKDITFCTMLFKMPSHKSLENIKHMQRNFEDFYLSSLEKLIRTFERVALWCDAETADFLMSRGLDKKIMMRVMDFAELPVYDERLETLEILRDMKKKYIGFFLKHKKPEDWLDYLPLQLAKPAIIEWAAENNKFKSDYFMWIDAGAFNKKYDGCWDDWTGEIAAHPTRCRFCISPTLGKTRPPFVPNFIYRLYKKMCPKIGPATRNTLDKQKMYEIAMTNADYDVPGGSFIIPKKWVQKFCNRFEQVRKIMKANGLVAVDQGVFQTMMKLDNMDMFELCYIKGYTKLYTKIAGEKPDWVL